MEFDISRVYSAVNADELHEGDKVIVSDTMSMLTLLVRETTDSMELATLKKVHLDNEVARFGTSTGNWCLAYLIERKQNCTNCGCVHCWYREKHGIDEQRLHTCSRRIELKTEQKAGALRPCRCGALPKCRTRKVDYFSLAHSKTHTKYFIECPVCFYTDGNLYGTKQSAIEAWNRSAK